MFSAASIELGIFGAVIKEDEVVVRTRGFFAVFAAAEEAEPRALGTVDMTPKAFEEVLVVGQDQGIAGREVLLIVGAGDEGALMIGPHLELVGGTDGPLTGLLETAADTLTAGDLNGDAGVRFALVEDQAPVVGTGARLVGGHGKVAAH